MALAAPWRRPAGSGSTAPPGRNLFDRLPDELLLNVLSKVPRTGVVLADGALQIDWRSVERVCRRWRRLALQHLPARLVIQLNDCGPEWDWEQLAEDFEELLPHVAARSVADCWIHADAAATPPELPAQLAAAVFPSVRKLELGGDSLLQLSPFLARCTRLEELRLYGNELRAFSDAELLSEHLRGLPAQLQKLRLELPVMHPKLAELVAQLVQPQGLSLLACVPSPAMWLPQLESCAVQVHTGDQLALLADGLQRAEARGLRALHVNDSRPPEDRRAAPARLPALADLPQLHTLKCIGFQPVAAWQCRHLTALLCANSSVQFDEYAGVLCTRLQRLELRSCPLPDGTFPVALCSLGQLTSLHLIRCRLSRLPPAFSNLRSLRELEIRGGRLAASNMAAMAPLRLTSLVLNDCQLDSLPHGRFLLGLRRLELVGPGNNLASPLPFAATAAHGLRQLCTTCPAHWLDGMECWADLEWKLHCFPRLEWLHLETEWEHDDQDSLEALAERCRSAFPRCKVHQRVWRLDDSSLDEEEDEEFKLEYALGHFEGA